MIAQTDEPIVLERAPGRARGIERRHDVADPREVGRLAGTRERQGFRGAPERGLRVVIGERRELAHGAAPERRPHVPLEDRLHLAEIEGARGEDLEPRLQRFGRHA